MIDIPTKAVPGQLLLPEHDLIETRREGDRDVPVVRKYIAGTGTKLVYYNDEVGNVIRSTKVGDLYVESCTKESDNTEAKEEDSTRITEFMKVSVGDMELLSKYSNSGNIILPKEGDVVLCRITRITLQRANVEIVAVENKNIPVDGGVGSNGLGETAVGGGSGGITFSISQASSDLGETFRGIIRSQDVRSTDRDKVKMLESFKPGDIVRAQVLSLGDGNNYYLTTARNDLGVIFAKAENGAGGLMYAIDWQNMICPSTGSMEKRKCAKPF
ncbi:hypothetical protein KAFR_0A07990 [Kazachstania africana CBS 2517]|uniref:Exosome complex component CSL4 C-terminal domain-containing protein n=1 Tax=Kazachstania africana (strain ATCC 22294 / BCRC 22015 / CBS 2517 / CECT 1963 / NBRC 1671 / NRRL Y-8276) TaxID=1071382 RepID=H2APD3_KAZAF|nr:hypothetical protein KAFR_0A07990 [Kazachstania africana CBS 2517]CCF56233.1 hypothetical protein KAFR_0A07990 [Kazachstania africana CBS 2517]